MPLDIGLGLLLGVMLNVLTGLSYGTCLALGVGATLVPDVDFIWSALRRKSIPNSEHRDGLHYPLLIIPSLGLLGLLFSPEIGLVLALGSLLHFVHDSVGIGFGIKWLFPFTRNSYLFLFQIKTPANTHMPKQRFYSWNDAERKEMIRKYAYQGWIKYVYFRPNLFGLFEYAILFLGISVAIASGFNR